MSTGFIYILTNPSFPQYVKIGYATDVRQRLEEFNRSTAVPFAFRVYATYEVDSALSDKKVHSILDKLNPALRSAEEIEGKRRVREFYAMSPEDAFSILEAIAEINGYRHRLKKWTATATEQADEALAQEIVEQQQERWAPFAFSLCNISIGEQIEFCNPGSVNDGVLCTVVTDRRVEYDGKRWSLTGLANHLLGTTSIMHGPRYYKYKGEWLNAIRERLDT